MRCERCNVDIYKFVTCDYCNRKIGNECIKSSKKKSKTVRLIICKDCWSVMPRRKIYKSAINKPVVQQSEYERYR